jgi:hypothetical protein
MLTKLPRWRHLHPPPNVRSCLLRPILANGSLIVWNRPKAGDPDEQLPQSEMPHGGCKTKKLFGNYNVEVSDVNTARWEEDEDAAGAVFTFNEEPIAWKRGGGAEGLCSNTRKVLNNSQL